MGKGGEKWCGIVVLEYFLHFLGWIFAIYSFPTLLLYGLVKVLLASMQPLGDLISEDHFAILVLSANPKKSLSGELKSCRYSSTAETLVSKNRHFMQLFGCFDGLLQVF